MRRFDLAALRKLFLLTGLTVVKGYQEEYMDGYNSLAHRRYDCDKPGNILIVRMRRLVSEHRRRSAMVEPEIFIVIRQRKARVSG